MTKSGKKRRSLVETATETPVPLPVNDTSIDVARRMAEEGESGDSLKSESSSDDEITKIKESIAKIEAAIAETQAKVIAIEAEIANAKHVVAEKENQVETAREAVGAFNENLSIEDLFTNFAFTKRVIVPSQSRDEQGTRLLDHLAREEQAFNILRAEKAGLLTKEAGLVTEKAGLTNLLVEYEKKLAEEKAKLPPRNQNVPFTKWDSKNPVTGQSFQVDQKEFTLSENLTNTVVQTPKLSEFFQKEYGKFPSNYFVRQEEKKVWEIMLDRLDNSISSVIVGSPGVGKSLFLMIFGFYVALVKQQSVLILRSFKNQGLVYLYLHKDHFARGKLSDVSQFNEIKQFFPEAWVFLDGFQDGEVNGPTKILSEFHVLATSCQYDNKSDDPAELVVLPAWRLQDLLAYANVTNWVKDVKLRKKKHPKVIPMLVKLQYFYSGGSMREFCRKHEFCVSRCESLVSRISNDQKCHLLSGFGQQSSQQVDRIRRHFIADTSNLYHYQNGKYWQTSVDSGWMMRFLQVNRKIEEVFEFYQYAKAVSGGFYGAAFECLFHHTIMQYHRTHRIVLLASDKSNYSRVELEIDNVLCLGKGFKECHEILKSLSAESYWYPDYAYLPFIDCVCRCRLVDKSGHIAEKFACIQVTIATKKVFRPHRMLEIENMKQINSSLRGYDAIYLVVTPSKETCDSFQIFQNEMDENGWDDYDLSDFADECPSDDESMEIHQEEQAMQEIDDENLEWTQVITYLDPDSVYLRKDGAHLASKTSEDACL